MPQSISAYVYAYAHALLPGVLLSSTFAIGVENAIFLGLARGEDYYIRFHVWFPGYVEF
jgi:hypothetical protein